MKKVIEDLGPESGVDGKKNARIGRTTRMRARARSQWIEGQNQEANEK